MRPRRRLLVGPFALALSLVLHGLVLCLLSLVLGLGEGQGTADKGLCAAVPVQIALLYSGTVQLDRDPQVLPASPSGQEQSEIPEPSPSSFAVAEGQGPGIMEQGQGTSDKGQGTKDKGQNAFFAG